MLGIEDDIEKMEHDEIKKKRNKKAKTVEKDYDEFDDDFDDSVEIDDEDME